jgi:hypothetical protein
VERLFYWAARQVYLLKQADEKAGTAKRSEGFGQAP